MASSEVLNNREKRHAVTVYPFRLPSLQQDAARCDLAEEPTSSPGFVRSICIDTGTYRSAGHPRLSSWPTIRTAGPSSQLPDTE